MGGERQDTDPSRAGTEPGLGPKHAPNGAAAPEVVEEPAPVDFDALHAALGDLPRPEEPRSTPQLPKAAITSDGRSSASYASARPHTIPPSHVPAEDLSAPAVIVAQDDTVPSAPPQVTTPIAPGLSPSGNHPLGPGSGPHAHAHAHPSSGPHPAGEPSPSNPFTPQPFPAQAQPVPAGQLTVRMPERPRRPRSPTVVVRARGPSRQQKLAVFMAMLVLLVGSGFAVLVYTTPELLPSLTGQPAEPAASTAPATPATTIASPSPSPPPTTSQAPAPTVTASATAPPAPTVTASAKPPRKGAPRPTN